MSSSDTPVVNDIEILFSMFHDGSISEGLLRDDGTCVLTVEIQYLAERVNPDFKTFRVELASFSDFHFDPWLEEGRSAPAVDFDTAAGLDLTVLSAETDDLGRISLHCTQDFHDTGFDGGVFRFRASGLQLFDESGKAMSLAELEAISDSYWEEFGAMTEQLVIRQAEPKDAAAIARVLTQAFSPSSDEARLRERVVAGGETHCEWVAEQEGKVIAHILYTPATRASETIGLHLAPIAVSPDRQRRGIGSLLLEETLRKSPIADSSVFVLGDPAYYERFGFEPTASARCPFDDDNRHFRALRWEETAEPFEIGYNPAFTDIAHQES